MYAILSVYVPMSMFIGARMYAFVLVYVPMSMYYVIVVA